MCEKMDAIRERKHAAEALSRACLLANERAHEGGRPEATSGPHNNNNNDNDKKSH